MITDMTNNSTLSPNSALISLQNKLYNLNGDVNAAASNFPLNLNLLKRFDGGYIDILNCTFITKAMSDFEVASCFYFQKYLIGGKLVMFGMTVVGLILIWVFCSTIQQVQTEENEYEGSDMTVIIERNMAERSAFKKNPKVRSKKY